LKIGVSPLKDGWHGLINISRFRWRCEKIAIARRTLCATRNHTTTSWGHTRSCWLWSVDCDLL